MEDRNKVVDGRMRDGMDRRQAGWYQGREQYRHLIRRDLLVSIGEM